MSLEEMNLEEILEVYNNAHFLILAYFNSNGHDHVNDFSDNTDCYWAVGGHSVYFSNEKFDIDVLKEYGPHYKCPIMGKICRKDDYTMIFMDLQTGDYTAGIFDNSKEETDPEIIQLLEDW